MCRYLLRIQYSAFCTRCSEFWNSVREKHNRVLLVTVIPTLFLWTGRGRAIVNRSHSQPWKSLSKWCSCTFRNNEKKCRLKNSGSAPKLKLKNNEQAERQQADMKPMLQLLAKPAQSGQVLQPATTSATPTFSPFDSTSELWQVIGRGFSPLRELMLFQMTAKRRFFSPTSRRQCTSYFQTLLHKKRRRGKSTILRWIRSWRTWGMQFDPTRFVIRQRFKFWTTMQRRPGESIEELDAGICQAAATCDSCFHCRPLRRSITYALSLLGEQWSGS